MRNKQLMKHLNRTPGVVFRNLLYKVRLGKCGDQVYVNKNVHLLRYLKNIFIGDGVIIKSGAHICACNSEAVVTIGSNTTVGYHTFIFSSSRIEIGDNCLIAPFVYIVDSDHNIKKDFLINQQGNDSLPVTIGNDVWIATGVKILKGVTIGNGAVIAAGAVVTTNVGDYEIYGGVPAKKISKRV